MSSSQYKPRPPQIAEAVFSILYLIFDLIAAIVFFIRADGSYLLLLCGLLTFVLGAGDAFHLVPRIIKAFKGDSKPLEWWSGFGLQVSSITMTLFYLILFEIWKSLFYSFTVNPLLSGIIWVSAIIRILLCLFPQNNWYQAKGNPKWGIYRNIPFAVLGICMIWLWCSSPIIPGVINPLWIGIAILLSFVFYFPVVLFAKKKPVIGMLMIPKTLSYIWLISQLLQLI